MIRYVIIFALIILFYSCDESFSPYTEYNETYVLNCILKSDDTFQVVTLAHSYPPGNFDQVNGSVDPAIVGADIRVWYGDSVYVFKDSSTTRIDTSRYNTPFRFYFNNSFSVSTDENIEIEVLLQNGRRLKAQSRTPREIFFRDESSLVVSPETRDIVQIFWQTLAEGTFYSPRFVVEYIQMINGEPVTKTKVVPVRYMQRNGQLEPVFPDPDPTAAVVYSMDAVTRALNEISEGDVNKGNYSVYEFPFVNVIAFDQPSSRYVSSTSQAIDDFTVSVNVADYTNIEGGLGVFGSYTNKEYKRLRFLQEYIESFGYNFIREN